MSERKWLYVWMLLAYIAGSVTSGALYLRGKQVGRAEQKRWDDAWYQAHPVMKEVSIVPTEVPECAIIDGVAYARLPLKFPAPPASTKPVKRRKAGLPVPVCAQHYDDGKTEFARCQPAKYDAENDCKAHPAYTGKDGFMHGCIWLGEIGLQPIPEQELILNCAPNFDCNKHSDIDPQGACIVGQEKNRAQDVCCPAYLEVNDCSWHHGMNPRESAKP